MALRLVLGYGSGIWCGVDAEGAGGISTTEDGGHPQVRRQAGSSGISQGALLRHLCSQVGADPGWVGVDEDADPDHRANLETKQINVNNRWISLISLENELRRF